MSSQEELDAALSSAQGAVDELATHVAALNGKPAAASAPAAPSPAPTKTPAQTSAISSRPVAPVSDRVRQILALEVPLVVRLAHRSMSVGEIMGLSPGAIIEFDRTVDQDLDLMINNCAIGTGVAVKVDERFGLRITMIGNVRERIGSLGAA